MPHSRHRRTGKKLTNKPDITVNHAVKPINPQKEHLCETIDTNTKIYPTFT